MLVANRQVFTEFHVGSGAATLFAHSAGGSRNGPVLVALHGGPGLAHDYLLPLIEQLASPALRVVAYDQRGVGRSTGVAASSHPLHEWAADLEALRLALAANRIHLLAHSGGGLVAVAYASAYPQRVASITFIDSVPPTLRTLRTALDRFHERIAALQAAGIITSSLPDDPTDWLCAVMPAYFENPRLPGLHDLNGAIFNATAYNALISGLGDFDLRPQLSALSMPTLSYIAETPFGSEMAAELSDALPQQSLRRFSLPGCGHLPWVEAPSPFLQEVESFLQPLIRAN